MYVTVYQSDLFFRSPVNQHSNNVLWNGMIHPFLKSTIYGALWYQGIKKLKLYVLLKKKTERSRLYMYTAYVMFEIYL